MRGPHRLKLPSLAGKHSARRRRELALIFAVIFGIGLASAPLRAREVPFGAQQVITTDAGHARSVVAADFDGDGDLDVLSASSYDHKIAWYENTDGAGAFGSQQVISTSASFALVAIAADVDGDGDLDVVSASFGDSKIAWYENTDSAGSFGSQQVISTLAAGARSVFAADLDGDGDLDLLSASSGDQKIAWYENTDGAGAFGSQQVITTNAPGAQSVFAGDVDSDGDLDALSATFADNKIAWYENTDGAGAFGSQQVITTNAVGPRSVFAADIAGDGDLDVLSASAYATSNRIAWYDNGNGAGAFFEDVISTLPDTPTSVFAADVDGDGDLDVLSASAGDSQVSWYENSDNVFGSRQLISSLANGAFSVSAADVDGDGDLDVLSASLYDHKIAWYENETIHRSAAFAEESVISSLADGAFSVLTADLDGDGDPDALSASSYLLGSDKVAWYENTDGPGPFGPQRLISTELVFVRGVFAGDIDGDGDLDVLSASMGDDKIAWYENTDGQGTFGSQQLISTLADGAYSVFATDIDGDGDLDVLSASRYEDRIAWYENLDGNGSFGTQQVISTLVTLARSVFAADVDGDGDLDALSASSGDYKIAWYENTDGDGAFGPQQAISTVESGVTAILAVDVDGDGDVDVLSAPSYSNRIVWYENLDGDGTFGSQQVISSLVRSRSIFAADVDGDGDLDVLSASFNDDKVAWYENTDGAGAFGSQQVISSLADGARSVYAADIDGDGDLDVLAAAFWDDKFAWYENRGGQFGLPTTPLAHGILSNSQEEVLFQIDFEHRGRAGDSDVELASLELLFEDGLGTPLTSPQADDLIDKVELFLDNGSGSFESASDSLVEQVSAFALTNGVETIPLDIGDPNARLAFGSSKRYFIVVTLTSDADQQTPDTFEAIHLTETSSSGRDASVSSVPLTLEHGDNTSTNVIGTDLTSATCHAPAELDLEGFTVAATVVCEAGTVLTAGNGLDVVSPGDLTLRAGERVVLTVGFSVGSGGKLQVEIDPALQP